MILVVADTGALISLAHVGQIGLIEKVFGKFYIAGAVWEELQNYENPGFDHTVLQDLKSHVVNIKSRNHLFMIMDYGESEEELAEEPMKDK